MAFLKFGKKKKEESLDMPSDLQLPPEMEQQPAVPVEQVLMMKQQGYTNNQIVQALQSQGYNTNQIYDAISQSNLSSPGMQPEMGMPDYGQSPEQAYSQQQYQPQSFQAPKEMQAPPTMDEERIQEIAESIIDEKWNEFAADIKKVIEWKDRSEDRLAKIEQQIIDLRMTIDSLTKSIISKISTYDQNITDVGTEIKAMEKVFQKVLPTLTESVNKLDRMAKGKEQQKK